jgi:hypothetical protein
MAKRVSNRAKARVKVRNLRWEDSDLQRWPRDVEEGWAKVPRAISLMLTIINHPNVSEGVDLTATYLALLSHNMGDGLVEIDDDQEMADMCGLQKKTWAQRIRLLEKIGMVATAPKLSRPIGYVLLRHPMTAIERLRAEGKVPDRLWEALVARNTEVGATPSPAEMERELQEKAAKAAAEMKALGLTEKRNPFLRPAPVPLTEDTP